MTPRRGARQGAYTLTLAAALWASTARAEVDWFAIPSVTLAHVYDDNLFSSATAPEADGVLRGTPALEAGGLSRRLSLRARYAFTDENYVAHSELDEDRAREHAGTSVRYEASRRTVFTTDADYTRTNQPSELSPEVGLEAARARAESLSLRPGVVHRFDPRSLGAAGYAYERLRLAEHPDTDTHTTTLDFERDVSRRTTLLLGYSFRQYFFEGQGDVTAHAVTAGGRRDFTPRTSVTLRGGPRFSEGAVDPEAAATVFHQLEPGSIAVTYGRGLSTAIGQSGAVTTETVEASVIRPVGRAIDVRAAVGWSASALGGARAEVLRAYLEASYRIANPLVLFLSCQATEQDGALDGAGGGEIRRNIYMLGIVLSGVYQPRAAAKSPDNRPRSPRDALPEEMEEEAR